jgi:hypothetical protein
LTYFLEIPSRVRDFYPGGVHIGARSALVLVLLNMMVMLEQAYGEVVTRERWTTWCIGGRCLLWPIKDRHGLTPRTPDYVSVHTIGSIMGGARSIELVWTEPVLWE